MYLEGGENLNFAIPVNDAKRLLLNQSPTLQNLPNETEKEPPTDAKDAVFLKGHKPNPFYWIYHIMAYDSRTGAVIVRNKGQLITVTVIESCSWAEGQHIDQAKDCKRNTSVAGNLVGRDVASGWYFISKATESMGFLPTAVRDYWISVDTEYITLHGAERNMLELWRIEKVEEAR
jgi:hypothetical protein